MSIRVGRDKIQSAATTEQKVGAGFQFMIVVIIIGEIFEPGILAVIAEFVALARRLDAHQDAGRQYPVLGNLLVGRTLKKIIVPAKFNTD